MSEAKSLRVAYGEALKELGAKNDKIVAMDADLAHATMTSIFKEAYPDRHFNFGIAEANMVCAAAGYAVEGYVPFVSTFALFGAGRAYEQIRNSVAYDGLNVKFGLSHSGLCVGEDGGSHQAIEDIALMRVIPGMTVLVPCDPIEMKKAVFAAAEIDGPVYIRVARPVCECITSEDDPFVVGKANVMSGTSDCDVVLVCTGLMVSKTIEAAKMLEEKGVKAAVVNMHTIKPYDRETVVKMAEKCKAVVTAEEHSVIGGLYSVTCEALAGTDIKVSAVGVQDVFGQSGKPEELFREYGLTAENIVKKATELIG